ncbi:TPA: type II toxin-antitoxin system RelE/ParE family toxin [Burkholderia vietnamiensis]|nr:type II toxin-antitoxin system RelE/ParE family toxin [Burkholderia vietnamiensis]
MAVDILPGAQEDLKELKTYLMQNFGKKSWEKAKKEIFDRFDRVDKNPNYGQIVPELQAIGILNFFQTLTSHHKIIYEPDPANNITYIHIVASFSQDFQTLLKKRMLMP